MGWGYCGEDSEGREIGYSIEAVCDEPGCLEEIDRGLSYACGGMHGEEPGCEKYFCYKHLTWPDVPAELEEKYDEMLGRHPFCRKCCKLILQGIMEAEIAA